MPYNCANNDVKAAVAPVNSELPEHWTSNPIGWFWTIEAQLALYNIIIFMKELLSMTLIILAGHDFSTIDAKTTATDVRTGFLNDSSCESHFPVF